MSERLQSVQNKANYFQKLLNISKEMSEKLLQTESVKVLNFFADSLQARQEVIGQVDLLDTEMKALPPVEEQEKDEYEKLVWLCKAMAEQIVELDEGNKEKIEKLNNKLMHQVKRTKESIRMVNAYSKNQLEVDSMEFEEKMLK